MAGVGCRAAELWSWLLGVLRQEDHFAQVLKPAWATQPDCVFKARKGKKIIRLLASEALDSCPRLRKF